MILNKSDRSLSNIHTVLENVCSLGLPDKTEKTQLPTHQKQNFLSILTVQLESRFCSWFFFGKHIEYRYIFSTYVACLVRANRFGAFLHVATNKSLHANKLNRKIPWLCLLLLFDSVILLFSFSKNEHGVPVSCIVFPSPVLGFLCCYTTTRLSTSRFGHLLVEQRGKASFSGRHFVPEKAKPTL